MATSRIWIVLVLGIALFAFVSEGQFISCTPGMIAAFSPCLNFITGSNNGIVSPSVDCCQAAEKLAQEGSNCMCSMLKGAVPFGLPINRSLAFSLPSSCGKSSDPLFLCKDDKKGNNGTVAPPPQVSSGPPPPSSTEAPPPSEGTAFTSPNAATKRLDMGTLALMPLLIMLALLHIKISP